MIKGVIIVNNLGVVRLAKFYEQVHVTGESAEQAQQSVIKRIYREVSKRQDNQCNYLEGSIPEWGGDTKLIYRHYATLYFVFACTNRESDLGILDLIQVFVEALDRSFENVCELDLIFHSDKCHYVLDCVEIKILRRVRAESPRRPPRHRRDACSMAWRCRFLATRPSQVGRVIAEK